mmetsp:Transcript_47387/g.97789  ORF Transcript_47387/g.97789 Transcript_47387/m.97789 type:complete len:95 (+) Transcript_47387:580-864(+)
MMTVIASTLLLLDNTSAQQCFPFRLPSAQTCGMAKTSPAAPASSSVIAQLPVNIVEASEASDQQYVEQWQPREDQDGCSSVSHYPLRLLRLPGT